MRGPWRTGALLLFAVLVGAADFRGAAAQDVKRPEGEVFKSGATKETEAAVKAALGWLKNHQSPDGRWDSDGFDAQCKLNRCEGPGAADGDVEATGLALLAFLSAGETHQAGASRETVKNGLRFLRDVQGEDGCFGPKVGKTWLRQHLVAALAMTEAYGMTSSKLFKPVAERGLAFALSAHATEAARKPADGEADVETAGWTVLLLKSALMSELAVDKKALDDLVADLDKLTDSATGRVVVKTPAGAAPTAVGVLGRIFAGHVPKDDPLIDLGAALVAKSPPTWSADTVDLAAWHFETLAIFQLGGERWKSWDAAMKSALVDHQRTEADRDERGSWDPVGVGAKDLGRVAATALACLDLEVYYRYGRVLAPRRPAPAPPAGGK
jgi:squalene-hopene cyclase-like protein